MKLSRQDHHEPAKQAEAPAVDPVAQKAAHALSEAFLAQAQAPLASELAEVFPVASGSPAVKDYTNKVAMDIALPELPDRPPVLGMSNEVCRFVDALERCANDRSRIASELHREKVALQALNKKLLEALKGSSGYLEMAFEAEGDTFGRHHNNAVDALSAAESVIAEAEGR